MNASLQDGRVGGVFEPKKQTNEWMKVKWRCKLMVYHDHNAKEQSKETSLQTHDIIPVYVHVLVPPPPFFLYACGIWNIIPKNHLQNGIFSK